MFEPVKRDYMDWVSLKLEDPATIGPLENEWNDFDTLTEQTKLLHNTKRKTQPWKTGLKIDYRPADTFQLFPPRHWLRRGRRALFGDYKFAGTYGAHPDPAQEAFFFGLVKEAWKTAHSARPSCATRSHRGICARMRWSWSAA